MKIKLTEVKTFVYTILDNKERQESIKKMLSGFNDWNFVFGKVGSESYWKYIHDDWLNILKTDLPFLVLEDDATKTCNFNDEVEFPDDADILYLGGSSNAEKLIIPKDIDKDILESKGISVTFNKLKYSEVNDDLIRVYNMHSTHAIMIVSDKVKKLFTKLIQKYKNIPVDIIFAKNLFRIKAYCKKYPLWYQKDGKNEKYTNEYYIPGDVKNNITIISLKD